MTWALILITIGVGSASSSSVYFRNRDLCAAAEAQVQKAMADKTAAIVTTCAYIGVDADIPRTAKEAAR